MRPLPLTAAAVLSAAALAVPAAPALAAGHGHGHAKTHATHAKTHATHAKTHDHLAQQERGAGHALANQLRQVTNLVDRAGTSDRISDVDRDAVSTGLQADADALTALQDQLAAATTHRDLVDAVHQGIGVRAVARTQFTVAAQAGQLRQQADAVATASPDLQTQVDAATADADAAVAAVLALTPDSTRAQVHEARSTAEAALADADTVLGTTSGDDTTDTPTDSTPTDTTPTA